MLYLGTTPLTGVLKQKLFTSSGTFVVPADVQAIWVDGCGGGAGGGGGYNGSAGGGGSGGGAGICVLAQIAPVTPAATLTITIGAGGTGGAVGVDGGVGGVSSIFQGTTNVISLNGAPMGIAGTATDGAGALGFGTGVINPSATGGGGAARQLAWFSSGYASLYFPGTAQLITSGAGGGGPASNGGSSSLGSVVCGRDAEGWMGSSLYLPGGTGNGTGGGGGAGGMGVWAVGQISSGPNTRAGEGGDGGQAGFNAHPASFGCGGGGGGGNAAGGNGTPGFIRIYYISAYTVA